MTSKRDYDSVSELIRDMTGDEELAQEIDSRIADREIVKQLMALRAVKGMTQGDVAQKMNCTQSRVSKLERGSDDELRLVDLRDYLRAVGHDIMVVFSSRRLTLISQVKFHIDMIQRCLTRLAELAEKDASIKMDVSKAHIELLVQTLKVVLQSAKQLPPFSQPLPSVMEIDGSCDFEDCSPMATAP